MIKRSKEWWMKFIADDDGSECGVGMTVHSSNGCCNPSCKVCEGSPCHSSLCEKCNPEPSFVKPQTGFDKYLAERLLDPDFKKEYDKALKEIKDYDRRENERRRAEAEVLDKKQTSKPS